MCLCVCVCVCIRTCAHTNLIYYVQKKITKFNAEIKSFFLVNETSILPNAFLRRIPVGKPKEKKTIKESESSKKQFLARQKKNDEIL